VSCHAVRLVVSPVGNVVKRDHFTASDGIVKKLAVHDGRSLTVNQAYRRRPHRGRHMCYDGRSLTADQAYPIMYIMSYRQNAFAWRPVT